MDEVPILIRLSPAEVAALDRMAVAGPVSVTRKSLIERIIRDAIAAFGPVQSEDIAMPPAILSALELNVGQMKAGEETSLKKLVGKDLWATLDDPMKRGLGKVFKELVDAGEFPSLKRGRKKSNNEQQYNKI